MTTKRTIKSFLMLGFFCFACSAQAAQDLKSSVEGITVSNAHLVAIGASHIYRGAAPLGRVHELAEMNISEVLIFKNETKDEVQQEISQLLQAGFLPSSIHQISFPWKNITDGTGACNQVLEALKILRTSYQKSGHHLYFHCTAGQDRTGLLAGLFLQLLTGQSTSDIFQNEMCARGYESGNPNKPASVNSQIQKNLTPIFAFLSKQISNDKMDLDSLHRLNCDGFDLRKVTTAKSFRCH